jgi:transposase
MFFSKISPCLVGIEACASAHNWGRTQQALGQEVRLIPPQNDKPNVKTNNTEAADAEAICEAVRRPNMRFVPIKQVDQQVVLSLHRARSGFVKSRTALANQIRGLLGEYGVVLRPGIKQVRAGVPVLLDTDELPELFKRLLAQLYAYLCELDAQVEQIEAELKAWFKHSEDAGRIEKIPGIGWLTATALVASIGDAKSFKNGRQLAAWLGLVPRQHSTGGKPKLLGISKRGDAYLRTLIIHGARAAIRFVDRDRSATGQWVRDLEQRRPKNVAVVARANKHARIVWALLAHQRDYDPQHQSAPMAA